MTQSQEPTTSLDEMENLIGITIEEKDDLHSRESLLEDEDWELELDRQLTRHTFAFHPLTKMLVVAGGMFAIVAVVAIIWSGMQGSGGDYLATTSQATVEDQPESKTDQEKAELLSELALREQKEQMEKLNANQPPPTAKKPEPIKVVPKAPPPKPTPPPPRPTRVSSPPPQPTPPPEPKVDPYSLWQELSLAGSYGGQIPVMETSPTNQKVSQNRTFSQDQVQLVAQAENPSTLNSSAQLSHSKASNSYSSRSSLATPLGVRVSQAKLNQNLSGTLSTPLVWHSQEEEELPPAMIILDEPILAQGGKVLFPANSTLIVNVNPHANSGLVELNVSEIRLPDGSFEKIANNSLTISREDGTPLIAQLQQVGGEGGAGIDTDTILDAMSIVGDLADLRGTRYLYLLGRRGNRTQSREPVTFFWYLPANIKVSIRVIKPFSVEEKVEPLQLDLEAINLTAVNEYPLTITSSERH